MSAKSVNISDDVSLSSPNTLKTCPQPALLHSHKSRETQGRNFPRSSLTHARQFNLWPDSISIHFWWEQPDATYATVSAAMAGHGYLDNAIASSIIRAELHST